MSTHETEFFVRVGRSSMQIWETSKPDFDPTTPSDGFRKREDAEKWIQAYLRMKKAPQPAAVRPLLPGEAEASNSNNAQSEELHVNINEHGLNDSNSPVYQHNRASLSDVKPEITPKVEPAVVLAPEQQIVLSPEQQHVLDLVKRGENVFFTGPAGAYFLHGKMCSLNAPSRDR
ncbi:hypothetical protein L218DRAFT_43180 [Marasmius fiardii PR-910]|nr:hypothetical protein L218DRAFT_43180 [Marasmius fiardii PR-910]